MNDLSNFCAKYPYTDLSALNIDWLIKKLGELAAEMNNFEAVNQIRYAGAWDITKQYPAWSVVTDSNAGYISMKPVPAGIAISNTDYWTLIADYTAIVAGLAGRVTTCETKISSLEGDVRRIDAENWLDGKKVVWYGDSWLTYDGNLVYQFQQHFPTVQITNRGIGGTLLTRSNIQYFTDNSGYQRITAAADLDSFDYIFISYGVNDWQTSARIMYEDSDEYCYNYALKGVLDYVLTNFPTCKPVVIFPSYCYKNFAGEPNALNSMGCNLPGYINNGIDICRAKGVNYINLYELAGVNQNNYASFMVNNDGAYVHPKPELFEKLAKIIYNGTGLNGIKCYGEEWSENFIKSTVGPALAYSAIGATINNVPNTPIRQVGGEVNLIARVNAGTRTVIHFSGYRNASSGILAIYLDYQDIGEDAGRAGIGNVGKAGWIDCYIEIENHDAFNIRLVSSVAEAIYGASVTIQGSGDAISYGAAPTVVSGAAATITDSDKINIINGMQYCPRLEFKATADIAAFTDIIEGMPKTWYNKTYQVIGYDITAGGAKGFYIYNGVLKNNNSLTEDHVYAIPDLVIPCPN